MHATTQLRVLIQYSALPNIAKNFIGFPAVEPGALCKAEDRFTTVNILSAIKHTTIGQIVLLQTALWLFRILSDKNLIPGQTYVLTWDLLFFN
jgi:hypothetical protein